MEDEFMLRRLFLSRLATLPLVSAFSRSSETGKKPLKIMMKSAWGSDDPTRASFPFLHGLALADAGHEVQIFLTGEATYLMRQTTADAVQPVGWPSLKETREKIVAKQIKVFS
jgi:predicted peroxiredoxin